MKKYLISLVVFVIILCGAWYFSRSLYHVWVNPAPQDGNIFQGDITIETVKSKPGSMHDYFIVISDKLNHALSCSETDDAKGEFVCIPFLKSPNPITKDTTLEDITIEASMTPLFLKLKKQDYIIYHVIDIEMSYIEPGCSSVGDKGCSFIKLPRYERWGL